VVEKTLVNVVKPNFTTDIFDLGRFAYRLVAERL
jgi:hypothetical protein